MSVTGNGGKNDGNKAVIAPGTGLGEGLIIGNKPIGVREVIPDFARETKEINLLQFLQKDARHVSYETVLSGGGLFNIAEFLAEEEVAINQAACEEVSMAALAGDSDICEEAMKMYVEILGAEVGNMALRFLAEAESIWPEV